MSCELVHALYLKEERKKKVHMYIDEGEDINKVYVHEDVNENKTMKKSV